LVGTGDVVLVVLASAGQTNSATTLDLFLPTAGDRPSYGAMVERRDGPSWLRDDDDDDDRPLIRFRPWRYTNLFTYVLTYLSTSISKGDIGSLGKCPRARGVECSR